MVLTAMSNLAKIMEGVSKQLIASIEAGRFAVEHRGEKGSAVEGAVRQFFREHLPSSVGVAHGEVIDRHGNTSTQLDVILYDETRTPTLYQDQEAGVRVIPVEGVIAAIEVKTSLRLDEIPSLSEAALRLKQLDCSSYYMADDPVIQHVSYAYGKEYSVLPPFYFVLAFDGPELTNLGIQMAQSQVAHLLEGKDDLSKRIDMVCVLNRGVVTNGQSDGRGGVTSLSAIPSPESKLIPFETKHALLMFYILASRYILQAQKPPIAIQNYIPGDFNFLEN